MVDAESKRKSLIATQYAGREAEMMKRIELGQQVMYMTLVLAVGVVTVGLQPTVPSTVLLMYPFLAMLAAVAWMYHFIVVAVNAGCQVGHWPE